MSRQNELNIELSNAMHRYLIDIENYRQKNKEIPVTTSLLNKYSTLTGYSLPDVLKEMKRVLHPSAYNEIKHQSYLTDIDSTFLTQKANELFGPIGIGWYYNYPTESVSHFTYEREVGSAERRRTQTMHVVGINWFAVHYAYLDENGDKQWSQAILSSGGSENEHYPYALKGAITSCIGAAFSQLEWQLYVYRGIVNHTNSEKMKPTIDGWLGGSAKESGNGGDNAKTESTQKNFTGAKKVSRTVS